MASLYVLATPLGNLGDLSARAVEVLRSVPVVAAEDTRRSRGLLEHIGAHPQLRSFHAHSPEHRLAMLLEILSEGRDVALVSDAGTPGISDPGTVLVAAAHAAGHVVVPIPGPSAIATILSASGVAADRFLLLGFVPRRGADRARLLARAATEEWTVVFYEAPGRVLELLEDLVALAGPGRRATVGRELTKMHEEIRHASLEEHVQHFSSTEPRGEFTVVLEGTGQPPAAVDRTGEASTSARQLLADGITRREVSQRIAAEYGLSRNDAYRLVMSLA
jgi:16S rRNA (cytidine1402-2'-O)-methyltransferase